MAHQLLIAAKNTILDNVWQARYPRPREIGFDNGGEFKAKFRVLCNNNMGMKAMTSIPWNPQSNAMNVSQ